MGLEEMESSDLVQMEIHLSVWKGVNWLSAMSVAVTKRYPASFMNRRTWCCFFAIVAGFSHNRNL